MQACLGGGQLALARFDGDLKLLDLARRNNAGITRDEFLLGPEVVERLLQGSLGLLDLSLCRGDVGLGHFRLGIDFQDAALGGLQRGLLADAVQLEQLVSLFHFIGDIDEDLRNAARRVGQDGHRAKERNGAR